MNSVASGGCLPASAALGQAVVLSAMIQQHLPGSRSRHVLGVVCRNLTSAGGASIRAHAGAQPQCVHFQFPSDSAPRSPPSFASPFQETTLNSFNDAMGPIGVKVSAPEAGHPADSQWLVSDGRSLFRFTDGMARTSHIPNMLWGKLETAPVSSSLREVEGMCVRLHVRIWRMPGCSLNTVRACIRA